MATSGESSLETNTYKIIQAAVDTLGVKGIDESLTAREQVMVQDVLNRMMKHWQSLYPFKWKYRTATIFLEKGKKEYELGLLGDHATDSYQQTSIKVDALSGAGTIDVDSIDGINSGDYIGILQDDGSALWTTVNGVPSGDTITLTDLLTDDSSVGNKVVAYTKKITKPLKIRNLLSVVSDNDEIQMSEYRTRQQYFNQASKNSQGTPMQFYFQPRIDDALLYIWQTASRNLSMINFSYIPRFDINIAADDEVDFPDEWHFTIVWNLALNIAPHFGVTASSDIYTVIKENAFKSFNEIFDSSREEGIVKICSSEMECI